MSTSSSDAVKYVAVGFVQPPIIVRDPIPGSWNSLTDPRSQELSGWFRKQPGMPPPNFNPYTRSVPPILVQDQLAGLHAWIGPQQDPAQPQLSE